MAATTSTVLAMRHLGCSQNKPTPQRSTEVRVAEPHHEFNHTHSFSLSLAIINPYNQFSIHPTKRGSGATHPKTIFSSQHHSPDLSRASNSRGSQPPAAGILPQHATSFRIASNIPDKHLKHRPQEKARHYVNLELSRTARHH